MLNIDLSLLPFDVVKNMVRGEFNSWPFNKGKHDYHANISADTITDDIKDYNLVIYERGRLFAATGEKSIDKYAECRISRDIP